MKILFVTDDFSGASLCARLAEEGHGVRAHVRNPLHLQTLDGSVQKVQTIDEGLAWAGKDGLVVCDDNGFGAAQDEWRAQGYSVVGGSEGGDLLEDDREHAQRVFAAHGLKSIATHTFEDATQALDFLKHHPKDWVLKRNGHTDKSYCYVGQLSDGRDVADLLRSEVRRDLGSIHRYVLQERVRGVEIGVARYFNGTDWIGPVEVNVEHKDFFPGNVGPKTPEMGTLLWYVANDQNRLFQEVLAPLRSHLQKIDFRGDIDVNCIVNENGAWPLEATTRFGYPAIQAQMALHESPWGEFLKALADGKSCNLQWLDEYAVVALVAVPPFPFCEQGCACAFDPRGVQVHFRSPPKASDWPHIHFEGVLRRTDENGVVQFSIADHTGYVLHVTGRGTTIEAARNAAYQRIENIVLPRMYFRTDIGERFARQDHEILSRDGWI